MAIEFCTIPEECHAQIFFAGGLTAENWQAEVAATGEILCLRDTEGNRYETTEALQQAGVCRFTLISHHVVWVETPEPESEEYEDGRDFDEPYASEPEDRI